MNRRKFRHGNAKSKLTEISNSGVSLLDLISNAKNRCNLDKRRRHDLTVKYCLAKIPGGLRPRDPPLRLSLRLRRRPRPRRHPPTDLTPPSVPPKTAMCRAAEEKLACKTNALSRKREAQWREGRECKEMKAGEKSLAVEGRRTLGEMEMGDEVRVWVFAKKSKKTDRKECCVGSSKGLLLRTEKLS